MEEIVKKSKEIYEKKYKQEVPPIDKARTKFFIELISPHINFGSLLDIGCGDGEMLTLLNNEVKVGIDIAESAVNRAKQRNESIYLADIFNLPPAFNYLFDNIISFGPCEYMNLDMLKRFLNICKGLLNKEGILIFNVMKEEKFKIGYLIQLFKEGFYFHPYTIDELKEIISGSDFHIIEISEFSWINENILVCLRKAIK